MADREGGGGGASGLPAGGAGVCPSVSGDLTTFEAEDGCDLRICHAGIEAVSVGVSIVTLVVWKCPKSADGDDCGLNAGGAGGLAGGAGEGRGPCPRLCCLGMGDLVCGDKA